MECLCCWQARRVRNSHHPHRPKRCQRAGQKLQASICGQVRAGSRQLRAAACASRRTARLPAQHLETRSSRVPSGESERTRVVGDSRRSLLVRVSGERRCRSRAADDGPGRHGLRTDVSLAGRRLEESIECPAPGRSARNESCSLQCVPIRDRCTQGQCARLLGGRTSGRNARHSARGAHLRKGRRHR